MARLSLTDSRRLTGANLFWDLPGAIIDVAMEGSVDEVIASWNQAVRELLDAVGYSNEQTCYRVFEGGASLLISAPIDVLYSMCELNEVAWSITTSAFGQGEEPDSSEYTPRLIRLFDEERNPPLLDLQNAAHENGVPFLWDDDEVSIGFGASTRVWSPDALPSPDEIEWDRIGTVPVALVTGTNGKSTTVRMTAAIMTAAGFNAGLTSTDFIRVGDRIIDTGDYSGTGGARTLMRQSDLEMAVLEVARGGLLRRGLGVEHANAAVITNVAADHLGEWGINTVQELIPAKFIVRRALGSGDKLILNADDEGVAGFSDGLSNSIFWFSMQPDNDRVKAARDMGSHACFFEDGWLVAGRDGKERRVVHVSDIPATLDGMVRYNISNALAAMAVAISLGIGDDAIRKGLSVFKGDESDNPGRGNWFEHNGVKILVDFAHNEHGMTALADAVRQVPSERIVLLMGQAGDRLDKDIADLVRAACTMHPAQLLVAELPGYERGREPFEVPELIRREAVECGMPADRIEILPAPGEATARALQRARPGDLLVLLALTQRKEALALVREFIDGELG